jgi:hypothetical protein
MAVENKTKANVAVGKPKTFVEVLKGLSKIDMMLLRMYLMQRVLLRCSGLSADIKQRLRDCVVDMQAEMDELLGEKNHTKWLRQMNMHRIDRVL